MAFGGFASLAPARPARQASFGFQGGSTPGVTTSSNNQPFGSAPGYESVHRGTSTALSGASPTQFFGGPTPQHYLDTTATNIANRQAMNATAGLQTQLALQNAFSQGDIAALETQKQFEMARMGLLGQASGGGGGGIGGAAFADDIARLQNMQLGIDENSIRQQGDNANAMFKTIQSDYETKKNYLQNLLGTNDTTHQQQLDFLGKQRDFAAKELATDTEKTNIVGQKQTKEFASDATTRGAYGAAGTSSGFKDIADLVSNALTSIKTGWEKTDSSIGKGILDANADFQRTRDAIMNQRSQAESDFGRAYGNLVDQQQQRGAALQKIPLSQQINDMQAQAALASAQQAAAANRAAMSAQQALAQLGSMQTIAGYGDQQAQIGMQNLLTGYSNYAALGPQALSGFFQSKGLNPQDFYSFLNAQGINIKPPPGFVMPGTSFRPNRTTDR